MLNLTPEDLIKIASEPEVEPVPEHSLIRKAVDGASSVGTAVVGGAIAGAHSLQSLDHAAPLKQIV